MDDLHATCVYDASDTSERDRVEQLFSDLKNIYPSALTLEHTGSGSSDFLEYSITYPKHSVPLAQAFATKSTTPASSLTIRYFIKNKTSLQQKHLKFSRLQHAHSFRKRSQTAGALVGTFLRLTVYSRGLLPALISALELLCELKHLEYSNSILLRTLSILQHNHPHSLWHILKKILNCPWFSRDIFALPLVFSQLVA